MGFRAEDPDIWGTYTNRDDPLWDEEVVEVFLDDDCDEWSFLEFEVSPNNVVVDLACFRRGERVTSSSAGIAPTCKRRCRWMAW